MLTSRGALCRKDIPLTYLANEPIYAGVNSVGLEGRNFHNEKNQESSRYYRYFSRGLNIPKPIEMIRKEMNRHLEIEEIIDFITQFGRGSQGPLTD